MKRVGKRLVSAITAICLGSMIAPFSVGAVTYDPCDVNHDGTVDISDVIVINQHLSGAKYFRNYSQLDANRSHTVDAADANCVMRKTIKGSYSACYIRQSGNGKMDPVNMPAVSSANSLDYSYANTSARRYIGYSFLTNSAIAPYTLKPTISTVSSTSGGQERAVIGTDDRVVAHGYENNGIVSITCVYIDNKGIKGRCHFTGFIVGDHTIATSAHCVYETSFNKDYQIQTYDRTGNPVVNSSLTAVEVHIPEDYLTLKSNSAYVYDNYCDYALITIKEDLSDYTHFEIGNAYNMTNSEASSIPIHVTGIPDNTANGDNYNDSLYTHNGSIYGSNNKRMLNYTVDANEGQSGAPVYTITQERYNNQDYYIYTALAIHKGATDATMSSNHGPLMTQYQLQFYKNNPNAHYQ